MKVSHTLICFFLFFSLQDGNTGLVSAQLSVYSGTEGENARVKCSFPSYRNRKFFCKEPCEQEDILIKTTDATAQSGRYSIDYKDGVFSVTITQLTKSDSGRYRCGAGSSLKKALYKDIEIIVVDAMLDGGPSAEKTIDARTGGNIAVQCNFTQYRYNKYFCKEECEGDNLVETISKSDQEKGRYRIRYTQIIPTGTLLYVSIKQLTQSDSGWYRCGLDRTDSNDLYQRFRLIVTDALTTSSPSSSVPSASTETSNQSESSTSSPASPKTTRGILYVRLTLVVLVIVSSLSVLVFCRKRTCKAKKPPVETQYDFVTETDQVYDDIGEAGRSRSPPVEISSVHTHARYTRPNGDETEDY
ncbi:polymeric immunoglobulin receptor-like isoform X2 [Trematomus bernacchii]|uniref:polymeric immunoglobulin receptor-like isoform X2 n=1 Tax=Trematomus bernacchii TaxID=40690 RepID=UPI00146A9409|nr:polymeric immunoglobulin receptor-like isoform X2 [Trematomus bernacchii]